MNGGSLNFQKETALYLFINADCPICRTYQGSFRSYVQSYPNTYLVFPGNQNKEAIRDFLAYDSLNEGNAIIDKENVLVHFTGAMITPQAVLMKGKTPLYSGKIDNRYKALGAYSTKADTNYVMNVLNLLKRNAQIPLTSNMPVGCYIESD